MRQSCGRQYRTVSATGMERLQLLTKMQVGDERKTGNIRHPCLIMAPNQAFFRLSNVSGKTINRKKPEHVRLRRHGKALVLPNFARPGCHRASGTVSAYTTSCLQVILYL